MVLDWSAQLSLLKRMLPMVAMMAAGYMAKQRGGHGNPLDDILRMAGGRR